MDDVMRKISEARVNASRVWEDTDGDKQVSFELTWDEPKVTFKYELHQFMFEDGHRVYYGHDYDCVGLKCYLCGNGGEDDCLELSEEQLSALKDKLIQNNLKLMYIFK